MEVRKMLGCGGLARYLGVSETAVRLMNIPPDATVDGRKAWSEQTAARVRAERDARNLPRRAVA